MASRFNFKILEDITKYNQISTKDPMTVYLMKTGECYFGEVPLFGGNTSEPSEGNNDIVIVTENLTQLENDKVYIVTKDDITLGADTVAAGLYSTDSTGTVTNVTYKTIAKYVAEKAIKDSDIADAQFTGDNDTVMTAAGVVKYVTEAMKNQPVFETKFFNEVATVTLTANDIAGNAGDNVDTYGNIFQNAENHVGDVGLVFSLNNVNEDNEAFTFVNLHNLLHIYTVESSDTVEMTETENGTHGSKFKAEVKLNDDSLEKDANGIKIKKSDANIDKNLVPDENKLVTEKAMAAFVRSVLEDYVSFEVDTQ